MQKKRLLHVFERKEGKREEGRERKREGEKETIFLCEKPRRINIRQERGKLERRVALRQVQW